MAISCTEIAAVGDMLIGEHDEAHDRSAVSRHFYAALHRCTDWKNTMPGMASGGGANGGTHQLLINELCQLDRQCSAAQKTRGRVLAAKLRALRIRRVIADYKLTEPLTRAEAVQQQSDAKDVFGDCDRPCQ